MRQFIWIFIYFIGVSFVSHSQCFDYYVKTPNNGNVKACSSGGWSNAIVQQQDAYTRTFAISSGHVYESGTNSYNCHGYAWHVSEGGNKVWINNINHEPNNVNTYWTDGSYKLVTYQPNMAGAKVFYGSADHSAVTTSNSDIFISKMSCGVLAAHYKYNSPYNDSNLRYYVRSTTPLAITGPSMIGGTTNGSYSVNYVPDNTTLTWIYNTNLLTMVSSSANGIAVFKPKTSTTVGDATITARFTNNSNGSIQSVSYYVGVNGPHCMNVQLVVTKSSDGSQVFPSGNGLCPYTYYYANLNAGTTLTNVNWGASSELEVLSASNNQLYFRTLSEGWGILNITATTTYGVTKNILGVTLIGGSCSNSPYYSISTNSSSNIVNITFNMDTFNDGINKRVYTKAPSFEVRMYSITGTMVKQARSSGESIQLDVSALPKGSYVIHIYDGISDTPQSQIIQVK